MFSKIKLGKNNTKIFRGKIESFELESRRRRDKSDAKLNALKSWQVALNSGYSLVHTLSAGGGLSSRSGESPLMKTRMDELFKNWDVISSSAICYTRNFYEAKNILGDGALNIHLDLNVPVQNILGTHTHDVWFPNHAGRENEQPQGRVINPFALVDAINSGRSKKDVVRGGFNKLIPFNKFETVGFKKGYNEILLVGRPGVSLYDGLPPSGMIKLKKIRYFPIKYLSAPLSPQLKRAMESDAIALEKIVRVNNCRGFSFELKHLRGHSESIHYLTMFLNDFFQVDPVIIHTDIKDIPVRHESHA